MDRRIARVLLCLVGLVIAWAAEAHAILMTSDPEDGAMLAVAPSQMVLTFNEPVRPAWVVLVGPDGEIHRLNVRAGDSALVAELPIGGPAGSRIVAWRVASTDGHPVEGSLRFSLGRVTNLAIPARLDGGSAATRGYFYVTRLLLTVSLLFGVGGAFFWAWIAQARADRLTTVMMLAGLPTVPLLFGLQGVDLAGEGPAGLLRGANWLQPLHSSVGTALLAALAALLLALVAGRRPLRQARPMALLALTALGLAFCLSGHAATAEPTWATRSALFLHGTSLAFWLGSLLPLRRVLAAGGEAGRAELLRFSGVIVWPIAALLAGGCLLAWAQFDRPADLWATDYGRVLAMKLVLVSLVLATAALNRWRLTMDPARSWHLRQSISVEVALIFGVLLMVGLWRFTPPPRALAEVANQPLSLHVHTLPAMADIEILPGRAGPVVVRAFLETGDFGPLNPHEVSLSLQNESLGLAVPATAMHRGQDGTYEAAAIEIVEGGRWQLSLRVTMEDGSVVTLGQPVELRD